MYLHLWQHCHRWGTASQSCPPWFCPLLGKWQAKHSHPFCLPLEKFSRADARGVVSTSEWGTASSTQWVPVSGDLLRNKQFFSPLCGHEGCKTLSVQSGKTSRGKSVGKAKVRERCCVPPIRTHQSFNLDSNPSDRPKAAMWPYAWRRWGKGAAPTSEPAGQATAVTRGR